MSARAVSMCDPSIPLTVGEWEEWGNPNDAKYYEYMLSYSPMENGARAPASRLLLRTAATLGTRVHVRPPHVQRSGSGCGSGWLADLAFAARSAPRCLPGAPCHRWPLRPSRRVLGAREVGGAAARRADGRAADVTQDGPRRRPLLSERPVPWRIAHLPTPVRVLQPALLVPQRAAPSLHRYKYLRQTALEYAFVLGQLKGVGGAAAR